MKLRPLPSPPVAYQLLKIIDGAADACDLADRIAFPRYFRNSHLPICSTQWMSRRKYKNCEAGFEGSLPGTHQVDNGSY